MAFCEYHPERRGIGVCMRCRAVICPACCTRVDDVNHCHACLKRLATKALPAPGSSVGGAVFVLLMALAGFFGLLWLAQGGLTR
jgi:hypothetical protein